MSQRSSAQPAPPATNDDAAEFPGASSAAGAVDGAVGGAVHGTAPPSAEGEAPASVWDRRYATAPLTAPEPWLPDWQDRLPGVRRAIDIGCGDGWETAALVACGVEVTAIDISAEALARCRAQTPQARFLLADVRAMPMLSDDGFDLAVAHLSLHYFDRGDTERALCEIARVLAPGGRLLGCVNAEDDWHYGAPDDASPWTLTVVDGVAKQFFTREKLTQVLAPCFDIEHLAKRSLSRYGRPKSVWEFFCRAKPE